MTVYEKRKVAVLPVLDTSTRTAQYHVRPTDSPYLYSSETSTEQLSSDLASETQARINADNALSDDIASEILARMDGDAALNTQLVNEAGARIDGDDNLASEIASEIANEANLRAAGDTAAFWGQLNLSGLPRSDPGNGQPWIDDLGYLRVGG